METYNLVEGQTDPIDCILKADGVALNLTGITVAILAYDRGNTLLALTGTVSVPSAATGQVRFSPTSTDLLNTNSPMKVRWKLTDGAGKIRFIPNADADKWTVRKP